MTLNDFANGHTPGYVDGVINRKYKPGSKDVVQVQKWIDAGYLFEHGTSEPSALMGHLFLTATGKAKCGIVEPVKESQGELF